MANWCQNEVRVTRNKILTGNKSELEEFKEFVSDGDIQFSFESIRPVPVDLKGTSAAHRWMKENWGTGQVGDVEISHDSQGNYLWYRFLSRWNVPEGIFLELRDKFPELRIDWLYVENIEDLDMFYPGEHPDAQEPLAESLWDNTVNNHTNTCRDLYSSAEIAW